MNPPGKNGGSFGNDGGMGGGDDLGFGGMPPEGDYFGDIFGEEGNMGGFGDLLPIRVPSAGRKFLNIGLHFHGKLKKKK